MSDTKKTVELEISGMSCGGCVKAVAAALGRVAGVATRSVAVGKASIEAGSGEAVQRAVTEIESTGFKARVL